MPRTERSTRIVVIEDHLLFAESLEIALGLEGHDVHRFTVPDRPTASAVLLSGVLRMHPHIVLLDLDLGPAGSGLPLVSPLRRAGASVVVVTGNDDRARWGECLSNGAATVIDKSSSLTSILAAIRRISDGRAVLDRGDRENLVHTFRVEKRDVVAIRLRLDTLTPRERQVLGRLMDGLPVRDIAHASVVSEATVRSQVKSILGKLEVSSQLAAVGAAHHARWQPPIGDARA